MRNPSNHVKAPFWGAVALIVGCCIGAGMLALPLTSAETGFFPALIPLAGGWLYMVISGLILLEVYQGSEHNTNLMGILEHNLGKAFKYLGAFLFCFLFYSILTAYLNGSSVIVHEWSKKIFKSHISIPFGIICNGVFLYLVILWGIRKVDMVNRLLVFGMLIAYFGLIATGLPQIDSKNLQYASANSQLIFSLPLFILSFGYQNLIPTIYDYLGKNVSRTKKVILLGTGVTALIYLIWNFMILGLIPAKLLTDETLSSTFLSRMLGYSSGLIFVLINGFSLFAIITSLLTVSLSFVNFISDKPNNKSHQSFYLALVLIPPLLFALINVNIFLSALRVAASLGAVTLFGILPALMLWKCRYIERFQVRKLLPGGKSLLVVYLGFSFFLVFRELWLIFTQLR
jgi:tyrosine-specific transport protein